MSRELEIFVREVPPVQVELRFCLHCGEPLAACECRPSSVDFVTDEDEDGIF